MTIKEQIIELIKRPKVNYIRMIKNIPGAWEWVEEHCDSVLLDINLIPVDYMLLDHAKIHTALDPTKKVICSNGGFRNFRRITIFDDSSRCRNGRPSQCKCAKDAYETTEWKKNAEIAKDKRKNTNLLETGYQFTLQNPNVREKGKVTKEKLDKEDPIRQARKQLQTKKTCLITYGFENPMQSKIIQDKAKNTNKLVRNVEYVFQCPVVKNKIKITNNLKMDCDNPSQNIEVKAKKIATCQENWNCDFPAQSSIIKTQTKEQNNKKIGRDSHTQLHISLESLAILKNPEKLTNLIQEKGFIEGSEFLNIAYSTLYKAHDKLGLKLSKGIISSAEIEIILWLKNLNINFEKDRKICKPNELDFLISNHKLAIEFDGLFYHSENGPRRKCGKFYHITKTQQCLTQGIQLIHIFEDEWLDNKDICKSIIKQKLGISGNKIAARKCQIKELTNKEIKDFVNNNHLQGHVIGSISLGLFYNNELVQVMTFGKSRYNKNIQYELLRLVTKIDTQVIGGTNRLWAYFLKTYTPESVVSYCDKRWFTGNIYGKLGFIKQKDAEPTYWYTDYKSRWHRSRFTKKNCVKLALEQKSNILTETELNNLTENIITRDILGLDKIWDCGQDTWIYRVQK